jgi:archaellum biogenesis ATPase FlaH
VSKEFDTVESHTISTARYCIADELIQEGITGLRECGSSDAMAIFENSPHEGDTYFTGFCFSCNQSFNKTYFHSSSHAEEFGIEGGLVVEKKEFKRLSKATPMTKSEVSAIIKEVGYVSKNYRGIKDEYSQFFGHLTKLDKNGSVIARYYPETKPDSLWPVGYKCRNHPKDFRYGKLGLTGNTNELSGQVKFRDYIGHRDLLIVGGEEDKAAAFQMLRENQKKKNQSDYAPVAVVSPTAGEGSAANQIRNQYEWICGFENIILGLDNDDAGITAMEEICKILPRDKIKIIHWTYGDPNKMLVEGKEKQFMSDFYNAKEVVDKGIFASAGLLPHIKEALNMPRLPLPSYMASLQAKTKGEGVIKNRIYNVIGNTSTGKTTHSNAMVYNFAFNPNEVTAVISLEATKGEYGIDILSLHLETNLYWKEADEVQEYLDTPEVVELANKLFINEEGESRFYVVDDRKGTVKSLEALCERLRCQYGVTVIVIDVLTDLLRVTSNEDQASHMNWQSNFVKNGVTIFNVLHTRKLEPSKNGVPRKCSEYDALGSSIFVQKAAGNFVINRNKECPDEDIIERNTTYVDVPKMRQGETGQGGAWYYDPDTRQCYDRDKFFLDNPDKLPKGYNLSVSSFDKEYYEEGGRGFKGDSQPKMNFSKGKPKIEKDFMDDNIF